MPSPTNPRQIIDTTQDAAISGGLAPIQQEPARNRRRKTDPQEDTNIPLNWVTDKVDKRDYIFRPYLVYAQSQKVDLRQYCPPIQNQGSLGSCTGYSIGSAIEILNRKQNKQHLVSKLFIYYNERLLEGTVLYDRGAYIRDGLKAVNRYGAPLDGLWPYIIKKFAVQPSKQAYDDAIKRRVTVYERCPDFNSVIAALNQHKPVVVGFYVYSSFLKINRTGIMPYPIVGRELFLGGHAVCLVGYDMAKQTFIARNSWGTAWGDGGYFYMPFKVIQNPQMSSDFWTMSVVTNP